MRKLALIALLASCQPNVSVSTIREIPEASREAACEFILRLVEAASEPSGDYEVDDIMDQAYRQALWIYGVPTIAYDDHFGAAPLRNIPPDLLTERQRGDLADFLASKRL